MNAYDQLTEAVVTALKDNVVPWHKSYRSIDRCMNYVSRREYSFLNSMLLPRPGEYLTPKQAIALGGDFRGKKTSTVFFFTVFEKEEEKTDRDGITRKVTTSHPMFRSHAVLHVSDVAGVESRLEKDALAHGADNVDVPDVEDAVKAFLEREGVTLTLTPYARPSYSREKDAITMPPKEAYDSSEAYCADLLRLAARATGHPSRLDRAATMSGSRKDMREELAAEMTSVMLCSRFEIDTKDVFDNSVAYIGRWLKALREDRYLVYTAARYAEKAAAYILGEAAEEKAAA